MREQRRTSDGVLGLGETFVRRFPSPEVGFRIRLLEDALCEPRRLRRLEHTGERAGEESAEKGLTASRQIPSAQRQLSLCVPLLRRLRIPRDTSPRIDRTRQVPILVACPKLELTRRISELSRLREEILAQAVVELDVLPSSDGRVLVQHPELVQGVRVRLVGLSCSSTKPMDALACVSGLGELAVEEDHPELVHRRRVSQRGRLPEEEDCSVRFLPRARAELVTDGRPVRRSRMVLLRRLEVEHVRLLRVALEPELARAVEVGEEELGVRQGFFRLGRELLDELDGFRQERVSVLAPALWILARDLLPELLGGLDEVFGKGELGFWVLVAFHPSPVLVDKGFRVRRFAGVDSGGRALTFGVGGADGSA
jgi:hypothetical protein